MTRAIDVSLGEVAVTLTLVLLAAAASRLRGVDLERDLGIAVVRSFLQLTAIGFVIQAIFDSDSLLLVVALLAVMVGFGSVTAHRRAAAVPATIWPIVLALATAGGVTLGLVLALGVFEPEPRFIVPVGGMVIGNAMTACAVALNRLADEVRAHTTQLEAALALGATSHQAARDVLTRSLRSGMITLVDSTKTAGVVFFPGTMVGMLLAGAEPTDAVRLQLILLWSLLGSVAISALIATGLGYRSFFTDSHQLREEPAGGWAKGTSMRATLGRP